MCVVNQSLVTVVLRGSTFKFECSDVGQGRRISFEVAATYGLCNYVCRVRLLRLQPQRCEFSVAETYGRGLEEGACR